MSVFYGWKLSLLSMYGNFMLQGTALYCMNAFMEPLCIQNGWSRMGINFSLGLAALMGQLAMPVAAAMAARFSLRMLMAAGAVAGAISTCAMGLAGNIYIFTFFFIIVWIATQFCGGVVANALMTNWFQHYRGVAFGLANSGISLSGLVLPVACLAIINHFGLFSAFCGLAVLTAIIAPLSLLLIRRKPQMLGLHPDGRRHEPRSAKSPVPSLAFRQLIRSPAIWYIGLSFGIALMSASGIVSQLKPRFSDLGINEWTAMVLAAFSAGVATLAKFIWGWLCDRLTSITAARSLMLSCCLSMLLLWLPPSTWTLGAFGICFSATVGGLWVVLPALTASYFGSANFLPAYKIITIFVLVRSLGFPIMGISHELAGSYVLADFIFAGALAAAFIMTLCINPAKAAEIKVRKHGK